MVTTQSPSLPLLIQRLIQLSFIVSVTSLQAWKLKSHNNLEASWSHGSYKFGRDKLQENQSERHVKKALN